MDSNFTNPDAEEILDVDRILRSLAHPRRREILGLLDTDPTWTKSELIANLVDIHRETGTPSATDLEIALVHRHLPTLEDADLISCGANGSLIRRGGSYHIVREMTDAAAKIDLGK